MRRIPPSQMSLLGITCIVVATMYFPGVSNAQNRERTGEEVVGEVCAACHETGANGAPRIGDEKAWSARASAGLTALTRHALDGIRQMPAHGGQPQLTDLEIARAVTYMVNASGGHWVEPTTESELMTERTGEQVVKTVCAECHQEGKNGAPRIGDTNAWAFRLQHGLPYAVHSAIRGHGGMPPRGGVASLTDAEIRNAIIYMLNPKVATAPTTGTTATRKQTQSAPPIPNHANAGGMDIYLGLVPAEQLLQYPSGSVERTMHRGVPEGHDWYHVNVSLLDEASHAPVTGAEVDLRVENVGISEESKRLEPMASWPGSYGNFFQMMPKTSYEITVSVRTPRLHSPVEARFRYKHD